MVVPIDTLKPVLEDLRKATKVVARTLFDLLQ